MAAFDLTSALSQALALHQAGRLAEAEKNYEQILKVDPNHFDSLHLLGVIHSQRGNHVAAVRQIDFALKINPKAAFAHNNRGKTLHELKRLDEALASYDQAVALKPDYAEAFTNRGNALMELKRLDEALASYDQAVALKPDYADAFNNRGKTLQELKRFDEALASYDKALAVKPDYALAFSGIIDCVNKLCDWRRTTDVAGNVIAHVLEKKSIIDPFTLLGYSGDPLLQLQCARNFVADKVSSSPEAFWTGEAQARGIDPARLVFASRLPLEDHLARHRLADLFLDTLPCNAHTTATLRVVT
jgi:tetratricopeptide (TPR) repeat protein